MNLDYSPRDEDASSFDDSNLSLLDKYPKEKFYSRNRSIFRWKFFFWILLSVFNATALVINVFIFAVREHSSCATQLATPRLKTHDFTKDAIKLEIRPFDDTFNDETGSVFRGEPRPELNNAWKQLLHGYDTRVPTSVWVPDATENRTLVDIGDGSGDRYATLAVLHELHCIRTLRQYLLPDYYPEIYEFFKPDDDEVIGVHIDHCLDILRQSSMCHADMTLVPYEWWSETPVPQNVINTPHLCANWDSVYNWAEAHRFDPMTIPLPEELRTKPIPT
ncbi:hypothetical protein BP6252_02954 [Coleophoma cylindrospora]|uniref:Tat pathway signal sequence n=1 Tax=Coleophoma cylindrospora TaxID=1849047 RepID=A0A3D8S6D0_9HELO|nr:hypothetical protein BP6252_02954 [Coleophoma cylindrospora]